MFSGINYILPVFFVSSMLSFKTDSEELKIIRENANSKDKIIFNLEYSDQQLN